MCPVYVYKDRLSGKVVEVIRKFDELEKLPTVEDDKSVDGLEEWEKVPQAATFQRGASFSGRKGHWGWMLAFLLSGACFDDPAEACIRLLDPELSRIELYKYDGEVHDSYLEPLDQDVRAGAAFINKFDAVACGRVSLLVDSKVFFDQVDTGKVKSGGWEYGLALKVPVSALSSIEVGRQHMSRHVLEETRTQHFDTYDRWYIGINLYERVLK